MTYPHHSMAIAKARMDRAVARSYRLMARTEAEGPYRTALLLAADKRDATADAADAVHHGGGRVMAPSNLGETAKRLLQSAERSARMEAINECAKIVNRHVGLAIHRTDSDGAYRALRTVEDEIDALLQATRIDALGSVATETVEAE